MDLQDKAALVCYGMHRNVMDCPIFYIPFFNFRFSIQCFFFDQCFYWWAGWSCFQESSVKLVKYHRLICKNV